SGRGGAAPPLPALSRQAGLPDQPGRCVPPGLPAADRLRRRVPRVGSGGDVPHLGRRPGGAPRAYRGRALDVAGDPKEAAGCADAGMPVVNAYMKKADVLFHAGDRAGARAALEQARDALGVGPNGVGSYVTAADREMTTRRIENNLRAVGAGETLVPNVQARIP